MTSESSLERLRPLLRTILPALLYAAGMEMVLSRIVSPRHGLFAIPGRHANPFLRTLLDQIDVTLFHFALLLSVVVVILLGMASLGTGARKSPFSSWVGPGMILLGVWSLARFFLDTPALNLAYQLLSLSLALGILVALFGTADTRASRAFAILVAAALTCSAYVGVSHLLNEMGAAPFRLHDAVRRSSELLALASGALVPALVASNDGKEEDGFAPALLAAVPAGLFLLLLHRRATGPPEPQRWSMGWSWDLPLPADLMGLLYAAVLFLFFFALFRALWEPRWRLRGYGLAFLFLAGLHHRIVYQHLLALMGLFLLTRGVETRRKEAAF
jgi:hypothetical protein